MSLQVQKGGLKCAITSQIDSFGGWGLFTGACPSNDLRFPGWIFLFLPTNDAARYLPGDAWFIFQPRPLGFSACGPILARASFQRDCAKARIGSYIFFLQVLIWILMCHILKKNDNLTRKVWGKTSDGTVCACAHYTVQTGPFIHTLFVAHKGIHLEIFQRQAPLNCWPGLAFWTAPAEILSPSLHASLQASDSSARYPAVSPLRWPSDGQAGNKNAGAQMPPVWLFKASRPVCYAQRATSAAGSSQRSALGA